MSILCNKKYVRWRKVMRLKYYLIGVLLVVIVPYTVQLGLANVKANNQLEQINVEHMDVTGDKKPDTLILSGEKYEDDSEFYRALYLDVQTSNGPTYHIPLQEGYGPIIDYVDLNNDKVLDVFITIDSGGSGGIQYYHGFSFKKGEMKDLGTPPTPTIYGQFLNGYKAEIKVENNKNSVIIDLENKKNEYNKLGLYMNGRLSEPTELMVDEYSDMKIRKNNKNKTILIGTQLVSGAYHADGIAIVESTWVWMRNKWSLVKTEVKPLNK